MVAGGYLVDNIVFDSILGWQRRALSYSVQAILVLVLGTSERAKLRQQIWDDIAQERQGQTRLSACSTSDAE